MLNEELSDKERQYSELEEEWKADFSLGKSHVMQLMKTVRFVCLRISGKALRKPALQKPSTGSPAHI